MESKLKKYACIRKKMQILIFKELPQHVTLERKSNCFFLVFLTMFTKGHYDNL